MLWDYLNTVPTLIAIINTVIAVGSSHFKPEQVRWKYALLGTSIVLGLAAAGATVAGQNHVLAVQAEKAAKLAADRDQIGGFIQTGDALLLTLRDQGKPVPLAELSGWTVTVQTWLNVELGTSYVQRFRDSAGLLHGEPPNIDQLHQGYWNALYEELTRLQQFSAELSPGSGSVKAFSGTFAPATFFSFSLNRFIDSSAPRSRAMAMKRSDCASWVSAERLGFFGAAGINIPLA